MTTMRNGMYALLAVVVGVMLVGMLPSQLSNLATQTSENVTLQGTSKEVVGNLTSGEAPTRHNDTAETDTGTNLDVTLHEPYADVVYYGFWGVGLVMSLGVYFVAKRILG